MPHVAAATEAIEHAERFENLWWLMHGGSEDPNRQVSAVTCYLDESGTHEGAPIAVVGGIILNKEKFAALDVQWKELLAQYSISGPLHMKDFRRPSGKLADMANGTRSLLFNAATKLINTQKIYSVAATLSTADFDKYFSKHFQHNGIGVYGMCFILCAHMNQLTCAAE